MVAFDLLSDPLFVPLDESDLPPESPPDESDFFEAPESDFEPESEEEPEEPESDDPESEDPESEESDDEDAAGSAPRLSVR